MLSKITDDNDLYLDVDEIVSVNVDWDDSVELTKRFMELAKANGEKKNIGGWL